MKRILNIIASLFAGGLCLQAQTNDKTKQQADSLQQNSITWQIPNDGGTPRDSTRIKQIAENTFSIQSSFEEGGTSVLQHAVSRTDLICRNNGTKPIRITLRIDLSGDGKRTDYDTKPESGMKLRDFIFIQPHGGAWQQVNGKTEGWVSINSFEVMPGETKLGLSPWYTYSDYIEFIKSLPTDPSLTKQMIGKSDGNREHWELTITDSSVLKEKKQKIFWQAREHAYETFSSYAMEGLVSFLLSEKAAAFRKKFIITIHPMTNIDGVALGYEYRAGYDFPEAQKALTGKLSFEAIDRLRPDYAVAWHNWVAPRDRNVVFYTDGENEKPTPRAWWRFTQLFPSLRAGGHRWKDENTPLRYNWEGRSLSFNNIHQYAMKKYGTRIWGWEMPWWNFTTTDARNAGAEFAFSFLTTIDELNTHSVPPVVERSTVECPKFKMYEFKITGHTKFVNPYRDAMLVGEFTSPSGKTKIIDGFYDGAENWKLRFTPEEEGLWSYILRGEGVEILQRGQIRCTAARSHGFIRLHPQNSYAFAHADSVPFFPMGDTNYGLYDDGPITPALRAAYLQTRRQQKFNFVRMTAGHSYFRAIKEPKYWAWGGTALQPDLDRFNPVFFQGLDSLLFQMQKAGMNAELLLLNFYRLPFTNTRQWTAERERLWLHYLLARYGAFENIFMWTISNEYETHPDGAYRLDSADLDWVKQSATYIKENDPYNHLTTVHPVISSSVQGMSPRSPFEAPWRIGGFYGKEEALDVLSQQTGQKGEGTVWDEVCQCWKGNDVYLTASIKADRIFGKPVMNTENGYEYLRGNPSSRKQVHHTDKVRRSSWRIVCAGGYFAAGFNGTLGHSDIWNKIDSPNHYTFILKDEGAAAQLGFLYRFFSLVPYWKMQPYTDISGNAVALADEGKTFVIYFPEAGTVRLKRSGNGQLKGRWFNPRTGRFAKSISIPATENLSFTTPEKGDWVLLLEDVSGNKTGRVGKRQ